MKQLSLKIDKFTYFRIDGIDGDRITERRFLTGSAPYGWHRTVKGAIRDRMKQERENVRCATSNLSRLKRLLAKTKKVAR